MEELTTEQLTFVIGSSIFALVFFVAVTAAIMYFFRRAERGDLAETEKFNEDAADSPSNEDAAR